MRCHNLLTWGINSIEKKTTSQSIKNRTADLLITLEGTCYMWHRQTYLLDLIKTRTQKSEDISLILFETELMYIKWRQSFQPFNHSYQQLSTCLLTSTFSRQTQNATFSKVIFSRQTQNTTFSKVILVDALLDF